MDMLSGLFLKILNMSITASIVILVVILIRLLINKAPKAFSFMLWTVVAFRLICPFSFSSIISVFSPINYFPSETSIMENTNNALVIPQINNIIEEKVIDENNGYLSEIIPHENYRTALNQSAKKNSTNSDYYETQAADTPDPKLSINITYAAAAVWLTVVILISVYSVVSCLKVKKRISEAVRLERNIYQCDKINSPFVLGVIRPKIYIPFGLDPSEREYILAHEKYHIKRLDPLTKIIYFIILSVHWFNPLVWLSFKLMTKDMEMSCDERVLADKGYEIRKAYSISLLSFASDKQFFKEDYPKRVFSMSPLAFGESNTKRRVMNVLNFKKPKIWVAVLIFLVCVFITVACASNPEESPDTLAPAPTIDFSNPNAFVDGLEIDTLAYSKGENAITVKFVNETGRELVYGEAFRLQEWEGNQWRDFELDYVVPAVVYILSDNSERYHKYTMPTGVFPLEEGKYRFTGGFSESENRDSSYTISYDFEVSDSSVGPNRYIKPEIISGAYNSELGDSGIRIFHDKENLLDFIDRYGISSENLDIAVNQKTDFENEYVIICYSMDSLDINRYNAPVFSFENGKLKVYRKVFNTGTASFDFKLKGYMLTVSKAFMEKYNILTDENVQYIVNYKYDTDVTPASAFEKSGARIDSSGKVSVGGKTYYLGENLPVFNLDGVDFIEAEDKYYFVYTYQYGSGVYGTGAGVFDLNEQINTEKNSMSAVGPRLLMRKEDEKNYILYRCDDTGMRYTVGGIVFEDGSFGISFINE